MLCPVCQSPVFKVKFQRDIQPLIAIGGPGDRDVDVEVVGIDKVECASSPDHVFWISNTLVPASVTPDPAALKRVKRVIDIWQNGVVSHVIEIELDDIEDGQAVCDGIEDRMERRGYDGGADFHVGPTPATATTIVAQDGESYDDIARRVLLAVGIRP